MRSPGIRLHKLVLFGWAVVITAVLLLLSLPVLAGKVLPALNLTYAGNCYITMFIYHNQQETLDLKSKGLQRPYVRMFSVKFVSFTCYL